MKKKSIKLADALLRRKELSQKQQYLAKLRNENVFKMVFSRRKVNETLDDVQASVPRVSMQQVTAAHDHYASALRRIDAVIQQANWTMDVEVDPDVMGEFVEDESLLSTEIPVEQTR